MRLDSAVSPATRICYVTEGVLLRRMLADPGLTGVSATIPKASGMSQRSRIIVHINDLYRLTTALGLIFKTAPVLVVNANYIPFGAVRFHCEKWHWARSAVVAFRRKNRDKREK